MAWNYEKDCDEEAPYQFGTGIYTPPTWNPVLADLVRAWEKAEAQCVWSKNRPGVYTVRAIQLWEELEAAMVQDTSKSRREYLEWLARGKNLDAQMGFRDVEEKDLPLLNRIVNVGFRTIAKEVHPDLGGTDQQFMDLKQAKVQLDIILREMKDIL